MSRRGYNAIYLPWEEMNFPNNLSPAPGEPELTFDQFCANLAEAGVDTLRVKFTGFQGPIGTDALSFEPRLGEFNDWGGRLAEMAEAMHAHGITIQAIPFENTEWRDGWDDHAWNVRNGGFLTDARDVFSDLRAVEAAKARIDAVIRACGNIISAWEICAEMSFIVTPEFWIVDSWADVTTIVRGTLVPWVSEIAEHIHSRHDAPVGNGQVFAPA